MVFIHLVSYEPSQGIVVIKISPGMSDQFKGSEQKTVNKTELFGGGQSWMLFKGDCMHLATKMSACWVVVVVSDNDSDVCMLEGGRLEGEGLHICPGGL